MTAQTSIPPPHPTLGEPVERYPYTTERGEILYWNCRFEPKTFRPQMADGTWTLRGPRVIYNLPSVVGAQEGFVWVTEGEKDADSLMSARMIATTAGAASGWKVTDTSPLYKVWGVVIVPDCDDAGKALAQVATEDLYPHVPVQVLSLPGANGYDVTDYLNQYGSQALMSLRSNTAKVTAPKGEKRQRGHKRGNRQRGHVTSITPGLPYGIDDLAWALGGTGGTGFSRVVYCPAHDDEGSTPGLSLTVIDDDHTLAFCHSGCEYGAIARAVTERMS